MIFQSITAATPGGGNSFRPSARPLLQRKCACGGSPRVSGECEDCRKKNLQRAATRHAGPAVAPSIVHDVIGRAGEPLDPATHTVMSRRFGHDFGRVRVHADARAAESARAVNAHAFTVGNHLVFDAGRYSPATRDGKKLLAHELAHVLQQRDATPGPDALTISGPDSPQEAEATRAEDLTETTGRNFVEKRTAVTLARQPKTKPEEDPAAGQGKAGNVAGAQSQPVQLPTCDAQEVDQMIPDPQKPNARLWGLTQFSGVGGQQPDVTVAPARSGKGVVVQPTRASLAPIPMKFLKPGRYLDPLSSIKGQEGGAIAPGTYPVVWAVTKGGSDKIKAGEQEHCNDIQVAFYMSLYRFAEIVNDMARQGTEFKDEAAARGALRKQAAIEPQNLPAYFQCLGNSMAKKRDDSHWHTPPPPKAERATVGYDSTARGSVAVIELNEKSLPEVGKHGSFDLLLNHAAPACIGFTNIKPAKG